MTQTILLLDTHPGETLTNLYNYQQRIVYNSKIQEVLKLLLSVGEWLHRIRSTHTRGYFAATKNNDVGLLINQDGLSLQINKRNLKSKWLNTSKVYLFLCYMLKK